MSFQFDFSLLDSPEFRTSLLDHLNGVISSKLSPSPEKPINWSTNQEVHLLNLRFESIGFGIETPDLRLTDLQLDPLTLQWLSFTFAFSYNGSKSAHLQLSVNAQGNPIAPKTMFQSFSIRAAQQLNAYIPAFVNLKVKIHTLQLSGSVTGEIKLGKSPFPDAHSHSHSASASMADIHASEHQSQSTPTPSSSPVVADSHSYLLLTFHENPLKRFEIESNLDGSPAGLTLRQALQEQLGSKLSQIVGKPIAIPIQTPSHTPSTSQAQSQTQTQTQTQTLKQE